jgi:hypothetical protein
LCLKFVNFRFALFTPLGDFQVLGLPLHFRNIKRIEFQPIIEKINKRLAGWKGRLLSKAGKETLVKSVFTAQPIYLLTVFPA